MRAVVPTHVPDPAPRRNRVLIWKLSVIWAWTPPARECLELVTSHPSDCLGAIKTLQEEYVGGTDMLMINSPNY